MKAFSKISLCSSQLAVGTSNNVPCTPSGHTADTTMKGTNTRLHSSVLQNSTGSTALSRNAFFLNAS